MDLRDLARRGSGLTLRRLLVLIIAMPAEAAWRQAMHDAAEGERAPTPDRLRDRQAMYEGGDQ